MNRIRAPVLTLFKFNCLPAMSWIQKHMVCLTGDCLWALSSIRIHKVSRWSLPSSLSFQRSANGWRVNFPKTSLFTFQRPLSVTHWSYILNCCNGRARLYVQLRRLTGVWDHANARAESEDCFVCFPVALAILYADRYALPRLNVYITFKHFANSSFHPKQYNNLFYTTDCISV